MKSDEMFSNSTARQVGFLFDLGRNRSFATYFLRTPASVFPRLCVAALAAGVSTALRLCLCRRLPRAGLLALGGPYRGKLARN